MAYDLPSPQSTAPDPGLTDPRLGPPRKPALRDIARGAVEILLLLVAAAFLALHFLHLRADFPNHSPWMDWSKYTDEGWYGDAAIRHFQRGHWYVRGDFNPAVALPVWPLLESLVFQFTGVSLAAARALTVAIFALTLLTAYLLARRWSNLTRRETPGASGPDSGTWVPKPAPILTLGPPGAWVPMSPSLAPSVAVLLLSVSPFCYVFTRLAILEPLLILLTLLALLTASYLRPPQQERTSHRVPGTWYLAPVLLGLLLPAMVLTKTTAVFLLPSIAWLLWARAGYRLRPFLRMGLIPAIVAASLWLIYFLAIVRTRFLLDYRYLFAANAYTGITASTAVAILSKTVTDGVWMGRLLFPLSWLAILIAVFNPRLSRRNPLIAALVLWAAGYMAFLAYHNNLQPRYYLVIAVPLTLLVPIVFESILTLPPEDPGPQPIRNTHAITAIAVAAALLATAALDARDTLGFVQAPQYTFVQAAARIQQIIAADRSRDPAHSSLVLSISGSNLSLMTGLLSICDDFGTMQLNTRVATYQPGWFVTWNHVEDDKMEVLAARYQLLRAAEFPVMDDPERNLLILYRLDPAAPTTPLPTHKRKTIPRLLRTSIGQQPSQTQLQH